MGRPPDWAEQPPSPGGDGLVAPEVQSGAAGNPAPHLVEDVQQGRRVERPFGFPGSDQSKGDRATLLVGGQTGGVARVSAARDGKTTVKTAPPRALLDALTLPPCSSTKCFTMARPRPVPPGRARDGSTR